MGKKGLCGEPEAGESSGDAGGEGERASDSDEEYGENKMKVLAAAGLRARVETALMDLVCVESTY